MNDVVKQKENMAANAWEQREFNGLVSRVTSPLWERGRKPPPTASAPPLEKGAETPADCVGTPFGKGAGWDSATAPVSSAQNDKSSSLRA
jgi:hypothetical protein